MIELLLEAERAMAFERVDRAEQLYRQVAAADPRNVIAVVGLARVASERGDDLGAYLLARRAMTMDPENDAARRLAMRLEEVLATRGEPVADPMPPAAVVPQADVPIVPHGPPKLGPPIESSDDAQPATGRRRSILDRLHRR